MAQRCRLTATAQIDGAVRAPGYEFVLGDGERGPHRTVRPVNPSINASHVAGHDHAPHEGADEALYEVIGEVESEQASPLTPTLSPPERGEGEQAQEQAAALPPPPAGEGSGEGEAAEEPAAPGTAEAEPRDPT